MDPIETTTDPVHPQLAIEHWRRKAQVTDDEFDALEEQNHARSFTMAGVADIDVIQDVYDALDASIARGDDFTTFKDSIGDLLESAWGGTVSEPGWRIETIFRTNVQSAYMAGHYAQAKKEADDRPYVTITFVDDEDQSEICQDLSDEYEDVAIPLDHPVAQKIWPPNHHNCRDGVDTLTAEQAAEMEHLPDDIPDPEVADGFDGPPDSYEPDPDDYSDELADDVERFTGGTTRAYSISMHDAGFDESRHPRDEHGRWVDAGHFKAAHIEVEHAGGFEGLQQDASRIFGHALSPEKVRDLMQVEGVVPGAHTQYLVREHKGRIEIHALVHDDEKKLIEMEHFYSRDKSGKLVVYKDLERYHESLQGKGISSTLNREQLRQAVAMGAHRIEFEAAWTGSYTWPKAGFGLIDKGRVESVIQDEFHPWLESHFKGRELKGLKEASGKLDDIRDLARFVHPSKGNAQLGKQFLKERGWSDKPPLKYRAILTKGHPDRERLEAHYGLLEG